MTTLEIGFASVARWINRPVLCKAYPNVDDGSDAELFLFDWRKLSTADRHRFINEYLGGEDFDEDNEERHVAVGGDGRFRWVHQKIVPLGLVGEPGTVTGEEWQIAEPTIHAFLFLDLRSRKKRVPLLTWLHDWDSLPPLHELDLVDDGIDASETPDPPKKKAKDESDDDDFDEDSIDADIDVVDDDKVDEGLPDIADDDDESLDTDSLDSGAFKAAISKRSGDATDG